MDISRSIDYYLIKQASKRFLLILDVIVMNINLKIAAINTLIKFRKKLELKIKLELSRIMSNYQNHIFRVLLHVLIHILFST